MKSFPFKNHLLFILMWLLVGGAGWSLRILPLYEETSAVSFERASYLVVNNLQIKLRAQIEQLYPDLPLPEKQRLLRERTNELIREDQQKFRQTVRNVARDLDEKLPPEETVPYLLASDSYYYLDLTQNIEETGSVGKVRGSKYFNEEMLAPVGYWEPLNLHPYVGFAVFKIVRLFWPSAPIMYGVAFTPLLVMLLASAFLLLVLRALNFSRFTCTAAGIMFVSAPIFLRRSMFGWYDNDPYTALFPFVILYIFFTGLKRCLEKTPCLFQGFLLGFAMIVYALFWHGWVFLESVIALCLLLLLAASRILRDPPPVRAGLGRLILSFLAVSFIGISAVFGPAEFPTLFREGWKALNDFLNPSLSVWPDLYVSVGELRRASLSKLIDLTGGLLVFLFALAGFVAASAAVIRPKDRFMAAAGLITVLFLASTFVLALGAERFSLLLLCPLILAAGWGLEGLFRNVRGAIQKSTGAPWLPELAVFLLCLVIAAIPFCRAKLQQPRLLNRIFNETWKNSLIYIKENTPPEAIINTWWPPGHFIKAVADRKVTFDGASINKPQGYWMARIFLSTDEEEAVGLLRMLNTSANRAADFLEERGFRVSETVSILGHISPLDRAAAASFLRPRLSEEDTGHLLNLTHGTPPPSYLMIYNELVEKHIQLNFVGQWNFKEVEEINSSPDLRKSVPPPKSRAYFDFLWTLDGGRPKFSGLIPLLAYNKDTYLFDKGIRVDKESKLCVIDSGEYGKGIPQSIFYRDENGQFQEKEFPQANLPYSVMLVLTDADRGCILLDESLARSMLMRMYYLEGAGLRHFKLFLDEQDLTGQTRIQVWEVDF